MQLCCLSALDIEVKEFRLRNAGLFLDTRIQEFSFKNLKFTQV